MAKEKLVKIIFNFQIVKTEKGNIAVKKNKKPIQFFYGNNAILEAENYINKLIQLGEIY